MNIAEKNFNRSALLGIVLLGALCAFVPALILTLTTRQKHEADYIALLQANGKQRAEMISEFLQRADILSATISQTLLNPRVMATLETATAPSVDTPLPGTEILHNLLNRNHQFCGVWISSIDTGEINAVHPRSLHVYQTPSGELRQASVPHNLFKRQYSRQAQATGKTVVTPLYFDNVTQTPIISVITPHRLPDGRSDGAAGVDIPQKVLFQFVENISANGAFSSLMSSDYVFLAHGLESQRTNQSLNKKEDIRKMLDRLRVEDHAITIKPRMIDGQMSIKVYTRIVLPGGDHFWSYNLIAPSDFVLTPGELGVVIQHPWLFCAFVTTAGLLAGLTIASMLRRKISNLLIWYQQILAAVPSPVLVTDLQMKVIYINSAAIRLATPDPYATEESYLGRTCYEVWHNQQCNSERCPRLRLNELRIATACVTINERQFEASLSYLTDSVGTQVGICETLGNLSDLQCIESVVDSSPSGIIIIDAETRCVLSINRAALAMYGLSSKQQLIGKRSLGSSGFLPAPGINQEFDQGTLDPIEGLTIPDEQPFILKSVQRTVISGRECFVESLVDISAHKGIENQLCERNRELEEANKSLQQQQQQLLHQEKMASIGQLAAGVAHEINNPVGFVGSNLRTLKDYLATFRSLLNLYDELFTQRGDLAQVNAILEKVAQIAQEEDINFILDDSLTLVDESIEGMNRVRDIIKNLKSFARPDTGEVTATDINDQLRQTLKMLNNELKYKCTLLEEYGDIPPFRCLPGEINQVFMNLIVNAANAIEKEGTISIRTWVPEEGGVAISVKDTGCGIPQENLTKIFDPFFTTKEIGKGTGLGLYISHGIVEKLRGRIEVKSIVGAGTTFTVFLPPESHDAR